MGLGSNGYLTTFSKEGELLEDERRRDRLDEGERDLSEGQISAFQAGVWKLMQKQVRRFTSGDSTSIPVEKARELAETVSFCIERYLATLGEEAAAFQLREKDVETLFWKGVEQIKAEVGEAEGLFGRACESRLSVDNIAYSDTLKEIGNFFVLYDPEFGACEVPCMIDYQLAQPIEELRGVTYIKEYLERLLMENTFCNFFKPEDIIALLQAYCPDYRGLLINVFDPVFTNAVGLALLGEEVRPLNISPIGRKHLETLFGQRARAGEEGMVEIMDKGVQELCRQLEIEDAGLRRYLKMQGKELAARIAALIHFGGEEENGLAGGHEVEGGIWAVGDHVMEGDNRTAGGHAVSGEDTAVVVDFNIPGFKGVFLHMRN